MSDIKIISNLQTLKKNLGSEDGESSIAVLEWEHLCSLSDKKINLGFYGIYLIIDRCGKLLYGTNVYQYDKDSIAFTAPGQIMKLTDIPQGEIKGTALFFHPSILDGSHLAKKIRQYKYFAYSVYNSVSITKNEQLLILSLFRQIKELSGVYKGHKLNLIRGYIALILNYCNFYYERQVGNRSAERENDILANFEKILNNYYETGSGMQLGLPTVSYFASQINLSPKYFGELIKSHTGCTAQQYIQSKVIEISKDNLLSGRNSIASLAWELGYKSQEHFSRVFKKYTGISPSNFRNKAL